MGHCTLRVENSDTPGGLDHRPDVIVSPSLSGSAFRERVSSGDSI